MSAALKMTENDIGKNLAMTQYQHFLLILWKVPIMYPKPIHFPVLLCPPSSTLVSQPPSFKRKITLVLCLSAAPSHIHSLWWPWELQRVTKYIHPLQNSFTYKCSLQWVKWSTTEPPPSSVSTLFWGSVSLNCLGWAWTLCEVEADLELSVHIPQTLHMENYRSKPPCLANILDNC